ncbi:MAG: phosphotransferase family protein [Candidatus Nanopelagicales bacterium]|jgi:aminoglycoside phosphotransferase (APT) family kinase protein|nr:phosphotransferase family protein [Candidatus Nanopelagicales bacterium]
MSEVPGAGPVRAEDVFDVAALDVWLRARVDLPAGLPEVRQFRGGASNLTFLLRYPDRDLVMRRPPAGHKAASAHDMRREFEIQRMLAPWFPAVPEVLGFTDDPGVLGSEFYVMAHVPGLILRGDLPAGLTLGPGEARDLALGMFDALADLHSVDIAASGLDTFWRGSGYVRRQVEGWSGRYRAARTDDVPDAEAVMSWLDAHQPGDVAARMIHGDWRFDNLVVDPEELSTVRAVLDWEMATVGDPLMDLGASLAYWVQADDDPVFQVFRRQPSNLPGMPTRDEVVTHYLDRTGLVLPAGGWRFYEVYGLFRLAVIAQQIWYRYRAGETTNPAFAQFGAAVNYLIARAQGLTALP